MSKVQIKLPASSSSSGAFQLKKWQRLLSAAQATSGESSRNVQGHKKRKGAGQSTTQGWGEAVSRWVIKGLQPIRQDPGSF